MTCAKVKKNLPLLAGNDFPARKARRLLAHIDGCPLCRKELEEYQSALGRAKASAREEQPGDWSESEWKALMARIRAEKAAERSPAYGFRPRWALASGIAAVIVLAVMAFLFKDSIFKSKLVSPGPGTTIVKKEEPKTVPEKPGQSKPAVQEQRPVRVMPPEYLAKNGGKEPLGRGVQNKAAAGQDVLSVKMVSQETGLQVVWFFNKNFEWKGDQK